MPHATTPDGVKLYYEEAGSGSPILFVHEYSGDWRSWELQMRFFARRHRCTTYSFRGPAPTCRNPVRCTARSTRSTTRGTCSTI